MIDRFIERARAAGVDVRRLDAFDRLPEQVAAHLREGSAGVVTAWDVPGLGPVVQALLTAGLAVTDDPAAAGCGITLADHAIAESGTLVLASGPGRPRATSLLPPHHVAILSEDRIVPTLFELMPRLQGAPSALAFITGPSRTADIELTPVRGAHGPVAVTVFLVPPGAPV
jgi:hypothetical protein